jgi:hypothetical protein
MNLPDEELAKLATPTWLASIRDEIAAKLDPDIEGLQVSDVVDTSAVIDAVDRLIGALRHERKERDFAVTACRETVRLANLVHDRVHEDARANVDDLKCGDDVHAFLHYCIGASRDSVTTGPRAVLGWKR